MQNSDITSSENYKTLAVEQDLSAKDPLEAKFTEEYQAVSHIHQEIVDRFLVGQKQETIILPEIGLVIEKGTQDVYLHGVKVLLTRQEFGLLTALARTAPYEVTYAAIGAELWGKDNEETQKKIKGLVGSIRKKLDAIHSRGHIICQVDGLGYRLNGKTEEQSCSL